MVMQPVLVHPLITDYFDALYDAQMTTKRARRADMRTICRILTKRHGTMLDPAILHYAEILLNRAGDSLLCHPTRSMALT